MRGRTARSGSGWIVLGEVEGQQVFNIGVVRSLRQFGEDVLESRKRLNTAGSTGDRTDIFVFNSLRDSAKGANRDVIRDFVPGTDVIQLSGIDANATLNGDQAFSWSGQQASAHGLWTVQSGANRLVRGDVDGDGIHDFEIQVNGVTSLTADDFIL
ncbi:hypothetical protein C9E82_15080 [Paracoccus siganidrum]|uniref:Peptidase M10 serralysin C-terminal domain-containing protein n=1 Tax=Paracoccus siganidrum TaxID=1276757 RepID=A0A419AA71_9RHOB|nr:hypothetical protein D3P05_04800 [Paracoccus siganidrum]RMC32219.1 hypothetical protein C9E82_15080 [Paracoccus siganidrum]